MLIILFDPRAVSGLIQHLTHFREIGVVCRSSKVTLWLRLIFTNPSSWSVTDNPAPILLSNPPMMSSIFSYQAASDSLLFEILR